MLVGATPSVATQFLNATLTPLVADLDQVPLRVLLEPLLLEPLGWLLQEGRLLLQAGCTELGCRGLKDSVEGFLAQIA